MKLYLTFEVDDFALAQRVISAVGALGVKPADMKYSLPTAAKPVLEAQEETVTRGDKVESDHVQIVIPEPRPNVSPGFTACQKIGPEVKQGILDNLNMSIDVIATRIKRTPDQTKSFLQLLWDRGVIKYDGGSFYVA